MIIGAIMITAKMIIGAIIITAGLVAWAMVKYMARCIYEVMDEIDKD